MDASTVAKLIADPTQALDTSCSGRPRSAGRGFGGLARLMLLTALGFRLGGPVGVVYALDEKVVETISNNNLILNFLLGSFRESTANITNGQGVVTLTPFLQTQLKITEPLTFDVPPTSLSFDGYDVVVSGLDASVDLTNLDFEIEGADLVIRVPVGGSAALHITDHEFFGDIVVTPTLSAPNVQLTLKLGWNRSSQQLFVEPSGGASADMAGASFAGCGALGWCNGLAEAHMSEIGAALADKIATALKPLLTTKLADVFEQFALSTCSNEAPASPPQGSNAWRFDWNGGIGLSIGADVITCNLVRNDAPAPKIVSIHPALGGPGDTVTIETVNLDLTAFGPTPKIMFGSAAAHDVSCGSGLNGGDCTVTVPRGTGTVDVQATTPSGLLTPITGAERFTYQPLMISTIDPAHGAITGGTPVRITGTGFDAIASERDGVQVLFGTTPASLICQTSTACDVISPAVANDFPRDVRIIQFGDSTPLTMSDVFYYTALPKLTGIGWTMATRKVSISLDSDAPANGAAVALSSSDPNFMAPPASLQVGAGTSSTTATLTFPSGAKNGSAVLTASYAGSSVSAVIDIYCPVQPCPNGRAWDADLCKCTRQDNY